MTFKFQPDTITLTIEDQAYQVRLGDVSMLEAAGEPGQQTTFDGPPDPTGLRRLCADIGRRLEAILGPGAYAQIFKERSVNFQDHAAVLTYVVTAVAKASAERRRALLGPYDEPETAEKETADDCA